MRHRIPQVPQLREPLGELLMLFRARAAAGGAVESVRDRVVEGHAVTDCSLASSPAASNPLGARCDAALIQSCDSSA